MVVACLHGIDLNALTVKNPDIVVFLQVQRDPAQGYGIVWDSDYVLHVLKEANVVHAANVQLVPSFQVLRTYKQKTSLELDKVLLWRNAHLIHTGN